MTYYSDKITLYAVGYWYDKIFKDKMDPKIILDYNWNPNQKIKLLNYLLSSHSLGPDLGYDWCRVTGKSKELKLIRDELTDGVFIWPASLVHYLEKYNIELPDYFIKNIESRNYCYDIKKINEIKDRFENLWDSPHGPNQINYDSSEWDKWAKEKMKIANESGNIIEKNQVWPI